MFWKRLSEQRRSLSFQLGLSYSLIFGLIFLAGIICLNAMISSHVMRGVDQRLMEQKRALEHYAAFHDFLAKVPTTSAILVLAMGAAGDTTMPPGGCRPLAGQHCGRA